MSITNNKIKMRYIYGFLFLALVSISCQNKHLTESKEKSSTIDSTLQRKVTEILKDKMEEVNALSGQVIVMETQTGEVKAMVVLRVQILSIMEKVRIYSLIGKKAH